MSIGIKKIRPHVNKFGNDERMYAINVTADRCVLQVSC